MVVGLCQVKGANLETTPTETPSGLLALLGQPVLKGHVAPASCVLAAVRLTHNHVWLTDMERSDAGAAPSHADTRILSS